MKIFLSYASQDAEPAKLIYLALRDQGHTVFFDRADLPAGDEFHNRIRAAIEVSHLFLFLISANAVDTGSYTLTELDIAEKANVKLLPVALGKLTVEQLPVALKAVTYLETAGNLPATVAAEVHRIAADWRRRRLKRIVSTAVVVVAVFAALFYGIKGHSKNQLVGRDGAPAVAIPAGTFIWGDNEESPRRELFVEAFYLDKYEVTVARYGDFSKATGNVRPPDEWRPQISRLTPVCRLSVSIGKTLTVIASGRAGVCQPTQSGSGQRAARMNENTLGETCRPAPNMRASQRITRIRFTRTASPRSVPILKG